MIRPAESPAVAIRKRSADDSRRAEPAQPVEGLDTGCMKMMGRSTTSS